MHSLAEDHLKVRKHRKAPENKKQTLTCKSSKGLILAAALAAAGYGLCLYPAASDLLISGSGAEAGENYQTYYASCSGTCNAEEKRKAEEYNEKLFLSQKISPYHYQGASASDETYESIMSETGVLCMLEIPSIELYIPVAHGTKDRELQYEAGHFYGTSLPVGGENTHAGIAAHSALPAARLFTDLDRVEEGAVFYIHSLDEKLTYRVDRILTVLPEEADEYLQIEKGRDLVTLYTCTPYGINSHRLLVRGERVIEDEKSADETEKETETAGSGSGSRLWEAAAILAAGPFLIGLFLEKLRL